MTRYRDSIVGGVVMVLAVVLFAMTFGIEEFTRTSLGADFVPRVTALVFFILGLVLVLRERKKNREGAPASVRSPKSASAVMAGTSEKPPVEGLTGALPVVLNIGLFAAYLLLLERVGFMILTPFYMFFQILLLTNPRKFRYVWFIVLSVAVSVLSYYMFVKFFQVMLPNGVLE